MVLVLHIGFALASLVSTAFALFRPTNGRLRSSFLLVGATLASGTFLVISSHAALVSACVTGLVYLTLTSFGLAGAAYRLSATRQESE